MVRGGTVITLELRAAPASLPVGVGCLYRKSLPRIRTPPTAVVLWRCLPTSSLAYSTGLMSVCHLGRVGLSAGGECPKVLRSISEEAFSKDGEEKPHRSKGIFVSAPNEL